MNQQRSRRFRTAQDAKEAREAKQHAQEEALSLGRITQAEYDQARSEATGSWRFDSNSITPGTLFMDNVAKALRWYSIHRLTTNPAWANLQVIISDANVPGEGEHKIMDYIRRQRNTPNYDPNTTHVLCGLDADLIMLGLATHEPHFYILREFVAFGKQNERERFAREGGQAEIFHPYQFLRLGVLREYLAIDLYIPHLPFAWDLESVIDDYVFLCFFVGNDFLPHMPTLEIREGAIELLIETYKKVLPGLGGYVTNSGEIDLARAEVLMHEVGKMEDAILKRRLERNKQTQKREYQREMSRRRGNGMAQDYLHAVDTGNIVNFETQHRLKPNTTTMDQDANQSAAQKLKDRLHQSSDSAVAPSDSLVEADPAMGRSQSESAMEVSKNERPNAAAHEPNFDGIEKGDNVKLGVDGWRERYYTSKFKVDWENEEEAQEILRTVARNYMEGLVWVLRYYYQGCCSWNWYYPYHYAPFAGDMKDLPAMGPFDLPLGVPFRPFEQLMGVLPAASAECLPEPYRHLMTDPNSPLAEFYPETFELDMNGKKQSWHAIVLLPFIDEQKLLAQVEPIHRALSEKERFRNTIGNDVYIIFKQHTNGPLLLDIQEKGSERLHKLRKEISSEIDIQNKFLSESATPLDTKTLGNIAGSVNFSVRMPPCGSDVEAPLIEGGVIRAIASVGAIFHNPQYPDGFQFPAKLLRGLSMPEALLTEDDRKRPALFAAGAPAGVILEAVLRSFQGNRGGHGGRGGRDGGYGRGGGRGGRGGYHGSDRSGPYDNNRHDDRGGRYDDRGGRDRDYGGRGGGRGGYNNHGGHRGYDNNYNGGYNNNHGGHNENYNGGGGYSNRGGYGHQQGGDYGRGGGRGGSVQYPAVHSSNRGGYGHQQGGDYNNSGRGGRGGGGSYGGGRGGHNNYNNNSNNNYNNNSRGGHQGGGNRGGYGHQQAPPQGYPPQGQAPFYSHQGYGQAPPSQGYGQAPPQGQSLSASLAPMLAASAQSLGVPHNYYQTPAQGGFQTSNVNLQQLYQQQQQSRGGRPY